VAFSTQKLILGYGLVGVVAFGFLILSPLVGIRGRGGEDVSQWGNALLLAVPVIAFLYLLTGPYSAPWTEPSVAAAFWAMAVAAITAGETHVEEEAT
jgi:hypothetical protein